MNGENEDCRNSRFHRGVKPWAQQEQSTDHGKDVHDRIERAQFAVPQVVLVQQPEGDGPVDVALAE